MKVNEMRSMGSAELAKHLMIRIRNCSIYAFNESQVRLVILRALVKFVSKLLVLRQFCVNVNWLVAPTKGDCHA